MTSIFRFIGLAVILSLAAFLVHTSAENPGTFHFVGFGWDVQMSATFAALLFGITIILTYFFGQTINYIVNAPTRLRNRRGLKKAQGGLDLIHQSVLALTAGDTKAAQKAAAQAAKKLPNTALSDLLEAQASGSEEALNALTSNPTSAVAGHLGLMENAQKTNQWGQVAYHAEKTLALHKNSPKAKKALLEAHLRQHNWHEAQAHTSDDFTSASLTLLEAIDLRETDPAAAQKITTQALKKHTDFMPLIMFQAGLLTAKAGHKTAETLLTKAFLDQPRLDTFSRLQDTLLNTTPDLKKRTKKLKTILKKLPQTAATIQHLCSADVALDANDLTAAKQSLNTAMNYGETRELCQRFAKLEQADTNLVSHADWLQKALLAPSLTQAGDASVQFWQSFRDTYTERGTTLTQMPTPAPNTIRLTK